MNYVSFFFDECLLECHLERTLNLGVDLSNMTQQIDQLIRDLTHDGTIEVGRTETLTSVGFMIKH